MVRLPRPVRNLNRWREVQAVLLRYGFDFIIEQEDIQEVRRFLHERLHLPIGSFEGRSAPERVRLMLTDLGPTFVKVGQILSSRSDLLPPDWVAELSKLQDAVTPFPFEQVQQILAEELGAPLETIFESFETQPVAAASLGQVHRARLPGNREVMVKVQRPGIQPQVQADIEILREVARLIEGRTNWGRKYGVTAVVEEFARTLNEEMDYRNEARNADRLRRNMASQPKVHVPFIYWEYVTARVLTMEAVHGVKVNDLAALAQAGINRPELAEIFIRSVFQQLLIDGFFHADPHPGNLFVDPQDGTLVFLDLGMMGDLLEEQRQQIGEMMQAALRRDSREIVRLVMRIGTPYRPVRESALQREIHRLLNRYLGLSLSEISFSALMRDLLGTIFGEGVRLPSELTLGIKTIIQAEEVAHTLDPAIRVMDVIETVSQQLLWQRLNPRALAETLTSNLREALRLARELPKATEQLLKIIQSGSLRVGLDIPDFGKQVAHLYVIANRLTAGLILAGMIIGSAIVMAVPPSNTWALVPFLGMVGFLISMVIGGLLVWMVFWDLWRQSRRRDR